MINFSMNGKIADVCAALEQLPDAKGDVPAEMGSAAKSLAIAQVKALELETVNAVFINLRVNVMPGLMARQVDLHLAGRTIK